MENTPVNLEAEQVPAIAGQERPEIARNVVRRLLDRVCDFVISQEGEITNSNRNAAHNSNVQ